MRLNRLTELVMSRHLKFALIVALATFGSGAVNAESHLSAGAYEVTVRPGKSLNVRTGPGTGYADIGSLADNTPLTVVGFNNSGSWAEIVYDDGTAWVSSRFITPASDAGSVEMSTNADMLFCVGTEPFWSAEIDKTGDFIYSEAEGATFEVPLEFFAMSETRDDIEGFTAGPFSGVIMLESCNDGMSDRDYERSINLLIPGASRLKVVSGCCSSQN